MADLQAHLDTVAGLVWGWPLIILLFGTHIFLTIRLRFIQRYVFRGIRLGFTRARGSAGDVSPFGALATALAATVGTGNIFGVAGAILIGGPGAVLWMWLTGVLGIATKYGEALLSVKYRVETAAGDMAGGPMYVLERGLKQKWLGVLFAAFTALAGFGIGNMVQSNAIATLMHDQYAVAPWITGSILAVLTAAVILGGIRSIAVVCESLVPFMAGLYVLGCAALLFINADKIPGAVALIFSDALTGTAAIGGFAGAGLREVVRAGISRGLFSNESGLGSAPIAAAAARSPNPVHQALVSSTGPFWDTVVVCAITGIVFVSSGAWEHATDKAMLSRLAFDQLPLVGNPLLTVVLITFVFSTILGWSYYGEKATEYLFGTRAIRPYRLLWVVAVFVGASAGLKTVWTLADILNGLMAVPNLIALLALSGVLVAETAAHRDLLEGKTDE